MKSNSLVGAFVVAASLLAVGSSSVSSASAGAISVSNASFEDPHLDDGGYTFSVAGWTTWSDNSCFGLIIQPGSDSYTKSTGGTAIGGDGRNSLALQNGSLANIAGNVVAFQNLSDTFQAGQTYTLKVAVGKRMSGLTPMDNFHLDIRTSDGALLAEYAGTPSNLTSGQFVDESISYTVHAGDAAIGKGIRIMLAASSAANSRQQVQDFDNVRFTSSAVPEPSAFVLAASGLIGLFAYAWRKRK